MILDHAPAAMIIVKDTDVLIKLPIRTLLPLPYRR
jgi:cytidine deaminase